MATCVVLFLLVLIIIAMANMIRSNQRGPRSCLKEDENKVLCDMAQSQYLQTLDVRAHDFMRSVIFVGIHHHRDG